MRFIKADSPQPAADRIAHQISRALTGGGSVLWLLSGGSSIAVAVAAANQLHGSALNGLHIALADERFGRPGHPDSNWQQLLTAGFALPGAHYHPVLQPGLDLEACTAAYARQLGRLLNQAGFAIGLFGLGSDGHTAGILPGSPAVAAQADVAGYRGPDFWRITITPPVIARLDEAVLYAMGAQKAPALQQLRRTAGLEEQPAQALKRAGTLLVYNEQMEDQI